MRQASAGGHVQYTIRGVPACGSRQEGLRAGASRQPQVAACLAIAPR